MAKLNQILAVSKSVKSEATRAFTDVTVDGTVPPGRGHVPEGRRASRCTTI